jgi:hypothetical protein
MIQISLTNFSIFFTAYGAFLAVLWSIKKALDLLQ